MERLVQAVLDGAVRTTFDIPRIGTQIMVVGSMNASSTRTGPNCIPTMELDDENMVKVGFYELLGLSGRRPCL